MRKIFFLVICLVAFTLTKGQTLELPKKQRIQNIEICGKGVEISTCPLSDVDILYQDEDSIVFVDNGKSLGNVKVDSITILELQEAFSILHFNMLSGFYESEKMSVLPDSINHTKNLQYLIESVEGNRVIVGNEAYQNIEGSYWTEFNLKRAFGGVPIITENVDFSQNPIDYADSVTTAFLIGSHFAKEIIGKMKESHSEKDMVDDRIREIINQTKYFSLNGFPRTYSSNKIWQGAGILHFMELKESNLNLAFFMDLGYLITLNKIALDSYLKNEKEVRKNGELLRDLIGEQSLLINFISHRILAKSNSPLALDLKHLNDIYWGKDD